MYTTTTAPYAHNKVRFINHNYNRGIFFDEKRKRFVDFDDMDLVSYQEYNSPFINYRPDYFGFRRISHDVMLYKYAQTFMMHMYKMRNQEFGRMYVLFRGNSDLYMQPLYEHHVKMGLIDKPAVHTQLKWDDASLTVSYYLYVLNRVKKYGLNYGPLAHKKFPDYKDTIQSEEDKLTEYFLYEMRKEPMPEREYPPMPVI